MEQKEKAVSIKTPLVLWKEKNPDISEHEFNDLLNSVRQNFSAMPDRPAALEYLKNFCHWTRDEHKIAVYLSYFVYDAIDFYYKEKDPDKPEHQFLKNKSLSTIKGEINQRGALAVWDEYKGYIPLNIRNTRKHKLYSMYLLLEIYNNLYKPIIDTSPAADEQGDSKQPEKKPLTEKINWKAGEDILRAHLEKLRDNKFIDYKNIDAVMSGDKIAVLVKHDSGLLKATDKNIIYLFKVWYDLNFIDKSFIQTLNKEGKEQLDWQINSFIMNSFNNTNNNPFNIDSLKRAKRRDFISTPEEIDNRMNTDLYNFIKSILP